MNQNTKDISLIKLKRVILGLLYLIGLTILFLTPGCWAERFAPIEIQNKTQSTLSILINDKDIGNVEPGSNLKNRKETLHGGKYEILAKDEQGSVIYSQTYSYSDIKELKWIIIIMP